MKRDSMLCWVEGYLRYRRKLGYQLKVSGAQLIDFARYADQKGYAGHLTTELALSWARLPENGASLYWARRLEVVRCFARYLAVFDPLTEVPPKGILGPAHRRISPHIYSEKENGMLLKACNELKPAGGLRPHTYQTLFGLLACTGLRISEALKLINGQCGSGKWGAHHPRSQIPQIATGSDASHYKGCPHQICAPTLLSLSCVSFPGILRLGKGPCPSLYQSELRLSDSSP